MGSRRSAAGRDSSPEHATVGLRKLMPLTFLPDPGALSSWMHTYHPLRARRAPAGGAKRKVWVGEVRATTSRSIPEESKRNQSWAFWVEQKSWKVSVFAPSRVTHLNLTLVTWTGITILLLLLLLLRLLRLLIINIILIIIPLSGRRG